jgi:hypothetical protein
LSGCKRREFKKNVGNCILLQFLFFTFHIIKLNACIKKMFFGTLTLFTMVNPPVVCCDWHVSSLHAYYTYVLRGILILAPKGVRILAPNKPLLKTLWVWW